MDIKFYRGPYDRLYAVCIGKLWVYASISGLWRETTHFGIEAVPMMREVREEGLRDAEAVKSLEKHLADLEDGRAEDRKKLLELIEKPEIWRQLLGVGDSISDFYVARERKADVREYFARMLASELEKLLQQFREAGLK